MYSIQSARAPARVITFTSVQKLDRAIIAEMSCGASGVRVVRNGEITWFLSRETMEALVARRKAKAIKKRWW